MCGEHPEAAQFAAARGGCFIYAADAYAEIGATERHGFVVLGSRFVCPVDEGSISHIQAAFCERPEVWIVKGGGEEIFRFRY